MTLALLFFITPLPHPLQEIDEAPKVLTGDDAMFFTKVTSAYNGLDEWKYNPAQQAAKYWGRVLCCLLENDSFWFLMKG